MQQNQNPTPPPVNPNSLNSVTESLKKLQKQINEVYDDFGKRTIELETSFANFNAKMSGTFGQTQRAIIGLREEVAIATPKVVGLGGSFQDVANIQESIAKSLKTNVITLGETVSDLFAAGKAVGISSSDIGDMVEGFQSAGIQTGNIKDNIQQTVDISRKVGVNTSAVFKLVNDNLSNINKYGFTNGVAGLAKMSAQAAGLRINMNEIFGFAERVFNPEGAVEMVSAFQRLGVAAGDLADPFRLMYLASEDTAELQNQVVKMTEKFTYFDEKTKEFKVFPNAKRDLREIAKETGVSYDELVKMSMGQQKMNMLAKDFKVGGIDEESKQFVANVAQFNKEKGGFTVKIGRDEKLVSELNTSDLKELKESQTPVTLEELGKAQLTEAELMTATLGEIRDRLAATAAGSRGPSDFRELLRGTVSSVGGAVTTATGNVRGGISGVDKTYEKTGQSITDLMSGKSGMEAISAAFKNTGSDIETGLTNMKDALKTFDYEGAAKPYISSGNRIAEGAEVAFTALSKFATTATNVFTDVKKPNVSETKTIQNNTEVKFDPLNVNGSITVVHTGTGGSVEKQNVNMTELMKDPKFEKMIQQMVKDNMTNGNYSNKASKLGGG